MKKLILFVMLCGLFLTGCGSDDKHATVVVTQPDSDENAKCVQLLERTPVSELEGEPFSPDDRYQVLADGASEDSVSGVRLPETLRIVNTESDEVLWEDSGYLWQSVLWSPNGDYLALAYAGRTWNQILFFETDSWTTWQFTLPDGSLIPEYTFLSEDWGEWTDENTIQLTVGRGGDAGEKKIYRCSVIVDEGKLTGHSLEETAKVLGAEYDFDHNGTAEKVEIVTLWSPELPEQAAWYELQIKREDDTVLWKQDAAETHAGWASIFTIVVNGHDYLLRYNPAMWQGAAYYQYQIFSLTETGEEVLLKENSVEFDINFGSPVHMGFDPVEIADFLEEIHDSLNKSTLLLSTESGLFRSGGSGAEFREDGFFWDEFCPYDPSMTLEENVRNFQRYRLEALKMSQ